jgi:hypothetical protein
VLGSRSTRRDERTAKGKINTTIIIIITSTGEGAGTGAGTGAGNGAEVGTGRGVGTGAGTGTRAGKGAGSGTRAGRTGTVPASQCQAHVIYHISHLLLLQSTATATCGSLQTMVLWQDERERKIISEIQQQRHCECVRHRWECIWLLQER